MSWRWAGRTAGSFLLVAAGVVFLLQTRVHTPGVASRSCGSAWDAVAGRVGWPQWWAEDLEDPLGGRDGPLVRTLRCPGAVNRRIVVAGALAAGAVVAGSAGALADRRRRRTPPGRSVSGNRLRVLGATMTALGALLTLAGLAGIALLAADPRSAVFTYVDRPVVVLVGLLLLLPAIVLAVVGVGTSLVADRLEDRLGERREDRLDRKGTDAEP